MEISSSTTLPREEQFVQQATMPLISNPNSQRLIQKSSLLIRCTLLQQLGHQQGQVGCKWQRGSEPGKAQSRDTHMDGLWQAMTRHSHSLDCCDVNFFRFLMSRQCICSRCIISVVHSTDRQASMTHVPDAYV
mmetsp:Transcript_28035/g.43776  ORF Transcript_28035/g.43776 Transcript_28035/m.43776 type:complete len:133 (-) Transcript_28035:66-464(-)